MHLSWTQLSLTQQLNCICDTLAKQAITNAVIEGYNHVNTQILPKKDMALLVWGDKIDPLRLHTGKAVAQKYHLHPWKKG
jgi:hypothetical protein